MSGYIYILSNPAFPHLLKIGSTKNLPSERARALFSRATGVPDEFTVLFYWSVPSHKAFEKNKVHVALDGKRYRKNREFFQLTEGEARETIQRMVGAENGVDNFSASDRLAMTKSPSVRRSMERNWTWLYRRRLRDEVEPLRDIAILDEPETDSLPLSNEIPLEAKIAKLRAVSESRSCHVEPLQVRRGRFTYACLNLFSETRTCFSFIDLPIRDHARIARTRAREAGKYVPLSPLMKMCDSLAKTEKDLYERALESHPRKSHSVSVSHFKPHQIPLKDA